MLFLKIISYQGTHKWALGFFGQVAQNICIAKCAALPGKGLKKLKWKYKMVIAIA